MTTAPTAPALTLQLLRHAKSSWADDGLSDRDRPLAGRGRAAAGGVGERLAAAGAPDLILCSPARRARETCERLIAELGAPPPVHVDDRLYLASAEDILAVVRAREDAPGRLMAIGHNPGMQTLAAMLAAAADPPLAAQLRRRFPTAALAEFDVVADDWRGLRSSAVAAARLALAPSARAR